MLLVNAFLEIAGKASLLESMALGSVLGLLMGLIPGINGRIGLLLVIPFVLGIDPMVGAVFLVAMHAVIHTSSSIPAILFGTPTSAVEAATVVDGFQLVRKGQAGEAVGVLIMSSLGGGLIGAVGLLLLAPIFSIMISYIATPEIAALSCLGLLAISALSNCGLAIGFAVAALGILTSTIGLDAMTGSHRFVFGNLELWDGVNIAAVVAGLFAIPEMTAKADDEPRNAPPTRFNNMTAGLFLTLKHYSLLIRSSIIGFVVGFIPGLGAGTAVWLAYGEARKTSVSEIPFGQGAIAGVIAPEAANNAKEGGALAPLLFLGIPGTTSMAILAGAFTTMGVEIGPRMLTTHPQLIATLAWTIVIANLIAVPICLAVTPTIARFAALRRKQVLPFALVASVAAAMMVDKGNAALFQIAVFSVIGLGLTVANVSRAPFLLGFVIGPLLEKTLIRSSMIYGWGGFMRPGVWVIIGLAIVFLLLSRRKAESIAVSKPDQPLGGVTALLVIGLLIFGGAAFSVPFFAPLGQIEPALAILVGIGACVTGLIGHRKLWRRPFQFATSQDFYLVLGLIGFLVAIPWIGFSTAAGLFVTLALFTRSGTSAILAGFWGLVLMITLFFGNIL